MRKFIYFLAVAMLFASCGSSNSGGEETKEEPVQKELVGEEISYATDSVTMKGYIAYDKNSANQLPGVIIIHEWWGHNDYVRERADMLADMGYVALAVDMYGDGKQAGHPGDAQKFAMSVMGNLDVAKARFDKALAALKSNPKVDPNKIAAIGYCFGGSVALTMANSGYDLDAVAAFHSGIALPVMPGEALTAKVLVCNGAADPFITQEQKDAFISAMDSTNADYKYVDYEGAVHAFTSKGADELGQKFELPLAYDADADSASWEELKMLFASALN